MTNLLASGHQSLNIIRRDLEDLFTEFTVPRRMLREVERVFVQAPSPIWLWREMDQILEEFMAPPMLRHRIERVFDRVLSNRGIGMHGQSFGSPFFTSPWRSELGTWNTGTFGTPHTVNTFGMPYNTVNTFGMPYNTINTFGMPYNTINTMGTFGTPLHGLQARGAFGSEDFTPPLELVEMQGEYLVRVDLPGVRETDVETRITEDNVLVIRGERRDFMTRNIGFGQAMSTFGRNTEYSEQNYGVFTRTVPLPRNINPAHINAFFRDGVLEVRIAKFDAVSTFGSFGTFNNIRNFRRIPVVRDDSRVGFGSSFGNFGTTSWNGEQRPHVN